LSCGFGLAVLVAAIYVSTGQLGAQTTCPPGQPPSPNPSPGLFVPTADCKGWIPFNHPDAPGQPATPDRARIDKGFQIAPVSLNLAGLDRDMVGLGSYIVNGQGGCNDCHTAPPYLEDVFIQPPTVNAGAYLAGGQEFGPFVSRNLTPDASGRPAGLTLDQFLEVLNKGTDFKRLPPNVPSAQGDTLQVMPWPVFRGMLDSDKRAIYEYLRAIPRVIK
jgi:hypothetical protein